MQSKSPPVLSVSPSQIKQFSVARASRDKRFDGTFYVAVKSTGIFCRPICPAPLPMEKNVEYYLEATQAIDAGFRPCLRCRPDSAPGSFAWQGIDTTVQRALKLLRDDFTQPISVIAQRIGVTERYLHKLVSNHLGLSPKAYRQYSQLMFAKSLLQQTGLSIGEVAAAVGFNSSRRLQDLSAKMLKKTPSQLRGKNNNNTATEITLFAPYRPPYDWVGVRDFLTRRAMSGVEMVGENFYQRVVCHDTKVALVKATHLPEKQGFEIKLQVSDVSLIRPLILTLRRVLDLDADPLLIDQALIAARLPKSARTPGLRLPGVWSAFEAGCRAIVGQQVSVKAAINQLQRIVDAHGQETDFGRLFPQPVDIATSDLSCLAMPGARKEALRRFAQLFVETAAPSDDDILSVKGVGPWTLDYINMRGYSNPNIYMGGDLVIKKVEKEHALNIDEAAPWRSYLTIQLWQTAS